MAALFGFVQLDFPGPLPVADGRYIADDDESVLVLRTLGAPTAARRRRRRSRGGREAESPVSLPLARVTAIRTASPFASAAEAERWLEEACEAEDTVEVLLAEGLALLNRALHAHAVASADPYATRDLALERAIAARIGYGAGEEVAEGRFSGAREADPGAGRRSRRRRRERELRPQERLSAVLRGRERTDACETMLLRARVDLDAGRWREAALQLRAGIETLLVELAETLADRDHERDLAVLRERQDEAERIAATATAGDLGAERQTTVRELVELCERILRRRSVLRG